MTDKNKPALSIGNSDEIDLGRIFGTLIDYKWLILAIALLFAIASLLYTIFASPVYRADALIQVEQTPQASVLDTINSSLGSGPPVSETEIELIESRMVVGKTINDLKLDIDVERKYFPLVGRGYARLTGNDADNIIVDGFTVNEQNIDKTMNIHIIDSQNYELSLDGNRILRGTVGRVTSAHGISLNIKKINASAGDDFLITKHPFLAEYNNILNVLAVADKGKDTGVLGLSYDNTDAEKASVILDSISKNYVFQNIARKTEEAEKSLSFIHEQLPSIQTTLTNAEDKLNQYRMNNDSVDMSLEAKSVLDTIVQLDAQLNELTFKETDISKLYTPDHPAYRALIEKRKVLQDERAKLNQKVASLPKTQQDILRLTRDVQVNQAVYMQLLNRQQELNITKASTIGTVRIIDPAMTRLNPVAPKKSLIVALGTILGAILAIGFVLIRKAMHRGIEGPQELETQGINVYASIPLSQWQKERDSKLNGKFGKNVRSVDVLAIGNPTDLAIESIRSLRTSLHFAMMEAKNQVLMISGVSPEIGKSFVSSNLAVVLSQAGQRVLLIDADMRKGYIHAAFKDISGDIGLSNILSGQMTPEQTLNRVEGVSGVDIIARGQIPPNPSELLMNSRFAELIDWAQKHYDIVIVDTPPILAVTDAAIIGRNCGTSLLVVRFEENTVKQVQVGMRRLEQSGIEVKGVILNAIVKRASGYYGAENYGYYEYNYENKNKS